MAGIAHLGVGLAAKRVAPKMPVGILVVAAYGLDIVFGGFWLAGMEHVPGSGVTTSNPYSHGLLMAIIWSALAALLASRISRSRNTGLFIGLMVFSHWIVDFISHPMLAVFPEDTGLPLLFDGSPLVGLGMWSNQLGITIGEYGTVIVGAVLYLLTRRKLHREKQTLAQS